MFDLSQLDAPEPDRRQSELAASALAESVIDPTELEVSRVKGFYFPGSQLNLINHSEKILTTIVDEKDKTVLQKCAVSLSGAMSAMAVANCGDLVRQSDNFSFFFSSSFSHSIYARLSLSLCSEENLRPARHQTA